MQHWRIASRCGRTHVEPTREQLEHPREQAELCCKRTALRALLGTRFKALAQARELTPKTSSLCRDTIRNLTLVSTELPIACAVWW